MSVEDEYEFVEVLEQADLPPVRPDGFQSYVFLVHLALAVAISIYSFADGFVNWFIGTGILAPLLLFVIGLLYAVMGGINWEREEMVLLMSRTFMVQEFELDRYVKYTRMNRAGILGVSYLATIITQWIWIQVGSLLTSVMGDAAAILGAIANVFIILLIGFMFILLVFLILMQRILKSMFSDVSQLIEFKEKWLKITKARQAEQKNKQETQIES
ncbi:MAG: hypothetical protein RTU63_10730 [Candidatus Thorarchaeota archaeon]